MNKEQQRRPVASDLQTLIDWLAERSATLPPLPDDLLSTVRQTAPEWWETSQLDGIRGDPTDTALAAAENGTLDHFVLIGRNGRGYASYFFHVVVAVGPLIVVARLLAPTVFDDELAGPSLSTVLDAIAFLTKSAQTARHRGLLGNDQRYLVLHDERAGRYMRGTTQHRTTNWHPASASPASLFDNAIGAHPTTKIQHEF
jgi:hypothetical protein